ncbi:MAG: hypothetical protein Phog2KO_40450 [Phototrophicaceae bacterium]
MGVGVASCANTPDVLDATLMQTINNIANKILVNRIVSPTIQAKIFSVISIM